MSPTWNVKNIVERFVWTFVQSAIGSVSVVSATVAVTGGNLGALRVIGLTALGAGVAALLSAAKNLTAEGIVVQSAKRTQDMLALSATVTRPSTPNERWITSRLAPDAKAAASKKRAGPAPKS